MDIVTVPPKFQVVIPQKVRELLGVKRRQKLTVLAYDNRIVLISIHPIQDGRGTL